MTDRKEVLALVERLRSRAACFNRFGPVDETLSYYTRKDQLTDREAADMLEALAPAEGGELEMETNKTQRTEWLGEVAASFSPDFIVGDDPHDIECVLRDFDRLAARVRELEAARISEDGKPVAWRVRDFNDGWILCRTKEDADQFEHDYGVLSQPLYLAPPPADAGLRRALATAKCHLEHMAAWITKQNAGYSFESLGEDMPEIEAALAATPPNPTTGDA